MKYVLFYESADDVATNARLHFPAHSARFAEFQSRGELIMIGPFSDAQEQGAMAVFASREGAEAFAEGDPFIANGVVSRWEIWEWNEVLS